MNLPDDAAASYDRVPYPSHAFSHSHPDRLAVMARLHGLDPAPADACGVLELGCASGGNVLPLAVAHPALSAVGIDISPEQVRSGRAAIDALGLGNVELRAASILEIDPSWGEFDYVVCHGVYSWVPEPVRDKILDVCLHNLAPNGVAYVSYNTYPGWHIRGVVRELARYRAGGVHGGPEAQLAAVRELMRFVADFLRRMTDPYSRILLEEVARLEGADDAFIYHEHLEAENRPFFFHEFCARVRGKGLVYLGESEYHAMHVPGWVPAEARAEFEHVAGDAVLTGQYLDFLRAQASVAR